MVRKFFSRICFFINCRSMLSMMTDRMEGSLSLWDRIRTWLHLKVCPGCRCYHSQLDETRRTLACLPTEEPPADLAERLWREHHHGSNSA